MEKMNSTSPKNQVTIEDQSFYLLPHDLRRSLYAEWYPEKFSWFQERRTLDKPNSRCYLPFDRYRCIFVHIPKTGGISIAKSLFGNLAGCHTKISDYQIIFNQAEFDSYFKFTFVRNPWERVFSAYHYLKQGGMHEEDRAWAEANLASSSNFDDFIKYQLRSESILQQVHFIPQYHFLCLPGIDQIWVDFLGFYENLQEDFLYVRSRISPQSKSKLLHENQTRLGKKLAYRDFYTKTTRDIVAEVYERDIALFEYDFDNSSLELQIKKRNSDFVSQT